MVTNLPIHAGDLRDRGSIPGLGRSPGGGHGNPLYTSAISRFSFFSNYLLSTDHLPGFRSYVWGERAVLSRSVVPDSVRPHGL